MITAPRIYEPCNLISCFVNINICHKEHLLHLFFGFNKVGLCLPPILRIPIFLRTFILKMTVEFQVPFFVFLVAKKKKNLKKKLGIDKINWSEMGIQEKNSTNMVKLTSIRPDLLQRDTLSNMELTTRSFFSCCPLGY